MKNTLASSNTEIIFHPISDEKDSSVPCMISIKGILDFNNVDDLFTKICNYIDHSTHHKIKEFHFNFSHVTQSNSAGLALLTNILQYAYKKHKKIQFLHLPTKLIAAAKVSDLDKIFPCSPTT